MSKTRYKILRMNLRDIPKVDLHRHLDCSMRWSTLLEIAKTLKIEIPNNLKDQEELFLVKSPMKDLASVLKKFQMAQSVLHSTEILERLAFEAVEDAYLDGIKILELRYAPTFITEGHENLNFEKIHQSFINGLKKAECFDVATGLICIIQRVSKESIALEVMNFAIENKSTFIGVDLADNEVGFEPKKFAHIFQKAKTAGLNITVHAGEVPTDEAPQYVLDAIEILSADRIGHGLQIIRNLEAVKTVVDKKIPLELCPISNWLTNAIPSKSSHPIRELRKLGVLTTINSDDPGIFGSTLTQDYELLQTYLKYEISDFEYHNDIAAKYSFIELEKKQKYWPRKL